MPAESTIRRVRQRLDVDAFDKLAGMWAAQRTAPVTGRRRVVAVDGKTLRGSGCGGQDAPHLLAALDHAHGAVLGQVDVGAKTNEITRFSVLLDPVGIRDAVITADALRAQRDHAEYLHRRGAHYLITVKGSQPHLFAQLKNLPWRQIPIAHESCGRGHGRDEHRTIKVTSVAAGLLFPHAAQAIQVRRLMASLLVQPRDHHIAAGRSRQHRCRAALPRPPAQSPTPNDHEVLNGFAGPPASMPAVLPTVTAG